MCLLEKVIKFRFCLFVFLLLGGGGYSLFPSKVVSAVEFTQSQALPSSDPNYRVELVDPPSGGYELFGDIPMRVHVNNNTGRELKDFKIQYVIKKDVTTTGDLKGIDFSNYLEFKNKPSDYKLSFVTDNTYLVPTLTRNVLPQLTEDFDITLNYRIKDNPVNVTNFNKVVQSWLVDGDAEIQVRFLSDDTVLAEQTLQLKKRNIKPDYRLRLVKNGSYDLEPTVSYPITITNDTSRDAWLQISPVTSGVKPIPQHPARFTFHLPDGVSFVKSRWDVEYPNSPVTVNGQDIEVELPPYLVSFGWVSGDIVRRKLDYYYLRLPIKFEGTVKPTYRFTVDSEDIPNIKPYTVDNKLVKQVDPLDLIKDGYDYMFKLDNGDYLTRSLHQSNDGFDMQKIRFTTKAQGLSTKQLGIYLPTADTRVYGIRADGTRVELAPVARNLIDIPYYETRYYSDIKYIYKDLDTYEEIEVDYGHNSKASQIFFTYEIRDKENLPNLIPVTYRVDDREKVSNTHIGYIAPKYNNHIEPRDKVFVNQTRGGIYNLATYNSDLERTPYKTHYQGYVIYKYEKGMTVNHDDKDELVKREVIGDYVYDLTRIIKYVGNVSPQYANFSPVFQDGNHRLTGKIFFNHDNFVPDSVAGITVRGHYDENRSLQDNYDSTSNKEYVIDFTYQSPRSLQVAALINGTTDINVVNTDDVYTFEHYLMNKSNQSYSNVEGEATLPKSVVLTELVTTDSRYKVLYKVGDSWVENPANLEDVTEFKVVPKVEGTSLGVQDVVKTTAKVKVKDVVYDGRLVIDSKMTVNGASTKAQDVVLNVKDVRLADGTLKVQYVNVNGDLLKENILQGRHGANYEVNVTDFEKDGKNYGFDHVDGDLKGFYEGTKAKVVKVYMKEKPRVYELPVSGKLDFIWVLFSLLGILVITGKHKKIKV